jgi:hypothetical protein
MLSEYNVSMFVFIIMEPMKNLICSVIPGKHDIILIQMAIIWFIAYKTVSDMQIANI